MPGLKRLGFTPYSIIARCVVAGDQHPSRCRFRTDHMPIPDIHLQAITDPALRLASTQLLNLIEQLHVENQTLRSENQQLRDENAHLKGGSGTPDIPPSVAHPTDHSSTTGKLSRIDFDTR